MSNKIVLITGASRGLGKNGALKLAQAGFDLNPDLSAQCIGS